MHFSKLRLSGFKSFVDSTELAIEPGMTGIVGPNGCGKSNLVEALRWVMGETSAKRMRGGEMDDVIFGGTTSRPPRNVAEVALMLDNSDRRAPLIFNEYSEIEVVRRIDRGSGSGYRINGKEVRARDVQLLFADAATGAQSTALVSQGRVGALINAKPSERRGLLEEAAGIGGLHSRRHEAELRLKAAEANLSRLDDVIVTLQSQLDGLNKQARQAQRYRRLSEHIRRAEAILLHLTWLQATAERQIANERLAAAERHVGDLTAAALAAEKIRETAASHLPGLRQEEAVAGAEVQRLTLARQSLDEEERRVGMARGEAEQRMRQLAQDARREDELAADAQAAVARLTTERDGLQAQLASEGDAQRQASEVLRAASGEVAKLETELTRLTEQAAATEARRASLARQQAEAGERHARLAQRIEETARQRSALEAGVIPASRLEEAAQKVAAAEAEIERTRIAAETAEQALRAAQTAEAAAREPLQAAETVRAKLRAESQALTELLAPQAGKKWEPVLDAIKVAPGYETALGAALGDDLTAPVGQSAPTQWSELPPYDTSAPLPMGVESLAAQVQAPPALARRLSQIGIVETAEHATAAMTALRPGQRLVGRNGGLWRWDGFVIAAGAPSAAAQRLRQRNRLAELKEALIGAEQAVAEKTGALQSAQAAGRTAAETERNARQAMRDTIGVLGKAREEQAQLSQQIAAASARLAAATEQAERLAADLKETVQQREEVGLALAELPDPVIGREQVAQMRSQVAEARTLQIARQGDFDRLVREASQRQQRLAAIALEERSWQGRVLSAAKQRATLEERRQTLTEEIERLSRRPIEIAEQRERIAEALQGASQRRSMAGDALAKGEAEATAAEKSARAAETELSAAREERVRCDGLRQHAEEKCEALTHRIAERLDCAPDQALAAGAIEPDETFPPIPEAESRFERLSRERDGMGPVNLMAEAEATELQERVTGLTNERADLTEAIARLRQGISALNREGRERLLAAFTKVNGHFSDLFVRLFGGGHAHLALDEGEDPLEAGLEIMASPPGKRLQVMSLLSGGEQALTALALLFGVFLTNPAPICVLDEVDAPLDDANVDRFCRLVEEIAESSQTRFLVITHHRLSMARMDRLFGVTMAERGISQLVSVDLQAAERLRQTA